MITMQNWRVNVPPGDGMLGYETETGVARLAIRLDGAYEGWQFKLDTRYEYQELNVFDFVHDGNMIYFDIVDGLGLAAGRYVCQVRGEYGGKRQLSSSFSIYVGESIGGVTVLENVPVAELFQLEQRLTALKTQCEQLAQTAAGKSESAVQAAAAALESAQQALESARGADESRQTAMQAAEAAARDAGTSEAAAARAETARADALTASAAAEGAAAAAQAALTAAQEAAEAAQNAAASAATDRQAAEQASETATRAASAAAAESSRAAKSASAAEESARAAAASAAAAAESERQAKASEEAAAESAAASKLDAQATAADRTAVAADKNAVAANRTAAETAAASAKTDAERIAALDTYSKREADELLAGKADQPYAGAEGACIHIPDSAGGMLGGLVICGNSVQDGTPSPDAPVEIQNVQSPVALTVCGANLINDTPNAAVVNRGVTFSAANGGGTMIVGTSTATFAQSTREKYGFFRLPAGTYTAFASVDGDTGGATIAAQIFSKETNAAIKNVYMGKPTQIVLDGGLVAVSIAVYESGVTLDCVARVMLVPGETAAPYEPYAGQAYSIPLVAADTETYPDALELCRVGDVCDSLERRDGVWGVNKAAGQDSPLWIPLSDEAQAVLDSIRLPAGVANVFATNSPAPELELTYRQTVISLPTPDTSDAGKVPAVNADGTGYELTGDRLPQVLAYTHTANPEIWPASYDAATGVFTCTEPHGLGDSSERWLIAAASTVKCLNEWGRTNSSVMLQKVSDTEFTVNEITSYGTANNSTVDLTQFHFEKSVSLEFTNLALDKFIMVITDVNIMSTGVVNFEGKSKKGSATNLTAYTHGRVTAIRAARAGLVTICWDGSVINNLGFAAATGARRVCETDEVVTKVNFSGNGSTGLRNGAQVAIYGL